jgi:hypothetical protein
MNRIAALTCLMITLIGGVKAAEPASPQEQQLLAVIKEVQAQQTAIAENQAKIDAKLVTVGEAVRIARIYSSRGGH